MKYGKVTGIVVKSIDYLETDKLITVLTFEMGSVTIKARGVRRKGAKLSYGTQQFFCGEFECVESHGRLVLTGIQRLHDYTALSTDIDKYYAACHYADIASAVIMEDHPDEEMLRFFLNSLHILMKSNKNIMLLTAVYEMRTAVLAGFAPVMDECVTCGSTDKTMRFSPENGGLVCCSGGIEADTYIINIISELSECGMREVFKMTVPDESIEIFSRLTRKYLETVLDRQFTTLNGFDIT